MATNPDPAETGPQLDRIALFEDLDAASLQQLAQAMRRRTFRSGEVIFHRDDPGQVLYVIKEGRVRIRLTSAEATRGPPTPSPSTRLMSTPFNARISSTSSARILRSRSR
jgi:hypothetical protein